MTAWPERQDLRGWLEHLAALGRLGVVRSEVDPAYALAAVLSRLDGRSAVLFERVTGSRFSVVGNSVTDRSDLAAVMGCSTREAAETYSRMVGEPLQWEEVAPQEAPVLANRLDDERGLLALPIPVHHELDGGRYLSAGVVVARDPSSGSFNLTINRLQVAGPRELRALVLPGRMRTILAEREEAGQVLELAIVLGVDPTVTLASQARRPRDVDELAACGALRGAPLRVTPTPALGLRVPADAEIVIEARIEPGRRELEGPFGEFPRTYSPPAPGPVLDVVDIWHRDEAIFQTILSSGREHLLVGGIPREADLLRVLREVSPKVREVRLTDGGSCRFHAAVSLTDPTGEEARAVLRAAFASNPVLKHVVTVNNDVDVFDDAALEWAIATRVQADRDLLVLSNEKASSLDPSADRGRSAKVGIDATVPPDRLDAHARIRVPGIEEIDIDALVEPFEPSLERAW